MLPEFTLLVLFAVRGDLQPPGQVSSSWLGSSQGHWPCPPWSLLGLMRHLSIPKKRGNLECKKTENTAHEGGPDVAHPSLGNLAESPKGSCWDSVGKPCRTEEGKLVLSHTVHKGKSCKWSLNAPWIHQGTIQRKTWKMVNIYNVWQEQAGKVFFFTL